MAGAILILNIKTYALEIPVAYAAEASPAIPISMVVLRAGEFALDAFFMVGSDGGGRLC